MTTPTIDSSDKHFPNELLERIIAKTDEIFTNTPITEFKEVTQEQLHTSILNTANVMIIGAKLALDYINEKKTTIMDKPIINPSTLSEEQRDAINGVYKTASFVGNEAIVNILEWLFGSEFFNQKGE